MTTRSLSAFGLSLVLATSALAQPPGSPPPDGRRPRGGAMMGRSIKMRLPRMIESAARLSGSSALSRKQARRMLRLVSPWRSRPRMSEAQAQNLALDLANTLNPAQKAALRAERPRFGRPGQGGRPPGERGPRFGGGRRPDPARFAAMRAQMAAFNPLYSGSSPMMASLPEPMREGMQRQRDRLNAALSQLQSEAR